MPTEVTIKTRILIIAISALVLVLAGLIAFLVIYIRKHPPIRKKRSDAKQKASLSITVGKLHQQGDRSGQQDCFAVSPLELLNSNGVLTVVADGMGGLADGDKISQAVVSSMFESFLSYSGQPEDLLLYLTEIANRSVNMVQGAAMVGKSGSTLVAGFIFNGHFHYLSVGDSRICLFRNGNLIQLNREHIYRHELSIEAINGRGSLQGAINHPQKGGLTSYLGMGYLKYVDIPAEPVSIQPGDTFVLMSDGVYNALSYEELSSALCLDAEKAAEKIESMIAAKAYEHQDNYTAVIVRCD